MYNKLKNENIIIDLELLIKDAQNFENDLCCYIEFQKERILSLSGNN